MSPVLIANIVAAGIALYVSVWVVFVASTPPTDTWKGRYALKGLVGALWPLWGAIALICFPFWAAGWLGERLGNWLRKHER